MQKYSNILQINYKAVAKAIKVRTLDIHKIYTIFQVAIALTIPHRLDTIIIYIYIATSEAALNISESQVIKNNVAYFCLFTLVCLLCSLNHADSKLYHITTY